MTSDGPAAYWYSRFVFERGLALIYLVAFLVAANQFVPLLGERGLLPAARFTQAVPFRASPSLFFLWQSDALFRAAAWSGVALACLILLGIPQRGGSVAVAVVWLLLWVLYLSFVNIGQTYYGFGWESLLLARRTLLLADRTFYAGSGRGATVTDPAMLGAAILDLLSKPPVADIEAHDRALAAMIDAETETTFLMKLEGAAGFFDSLAGLLEPLDKDDVAQRSAAEMEKA